jgi:hypothetical protein
MRILAFTLMALTLVGCGTTVTPQPQPDLSMVLPNGPDMVPYSTCGHPGDKGNSLGIGQYCVMFVGDCPNNLFCSSAANANAPSPTYFCTTSCSTPGPDPTCGENALCVCGKPGLCGCTPAYCAAGMAG